MSPVGTEQDDFAQTGHTYMTESVCLRPTILVFECYLRQQTQIAAVH